MSLSDPEVLELHELCQALDDGRITAEQRTRLEGWLASSEEARRVYVRAMALSASLMDYAGEMQSEVPDAPAEKSRIVRPAAWIWGLGALAAAASIAVAFWWFEVRPARTTGEPMVASLESDETVARLSGAKDSHWEGTALQTGDELHAGQQIKLASGFAEVTFDSGAQVTVEGPCSLELNSAWEAALHRGTLQAKVPPEAIGFRVSNPSVNVVDLGTEFSMVADEAGTTEVFVLKGAVEAAGRDAAGLEQTPVVLRETQARRFARNGGGEVRNREAKLEKLTRKVVLDRLARPANYVHWTFDEAGGELAAASVPGFDARVVSTSDERRSEGYHGQALRLDGHSYARAPFAGLSRRAARTVAFWVNVPADAALPEAAPMVAWPLGGGGRQITVGWNRNPNQGALGALRTDAGRGGAVGSTALRDGRWHHLAVVFSPRAKPGRDDGPVQLRQYVDGRLEAASAKLRTGKRNRGAERAFATTEDDTLWIGCAVNGAEGEHFRGLIDELFVADAALSPQEIRQLMRENKPATAEILAAQ